METEYFFTPNVRKEDQMRSEAAKLGSRLIDRLEAKIAENGGGKKFRGEWWFTEATVSVGKSNFRRFAVVREEDESPSSSARRRVTTIGESYHDFPFTQTEEEIASDGNIKPGRSISKGINYNFLITTMNDFLREINKWRPIT